jgi:HEAT repeat protein
MLLGMLAPCAHAEIDFTKPFNPANGGSLYNVGPTGILGFYNGGAVSDQIRVRQVAKGSPADGKLLYGDVITGMNGVPFKKGDNLITTIGNAIDEAEAGKDGGKITFTVWRDANVTKRDAKRTISAKAIDVSDFIEVIEADTAADLARYLSERQLKQAEAEEWKEMYEKFPIDSSVREVSITLEPMGAYSDTSPYDCPKVTKIRERAYPHLVKKLQGGIGGWNTHMVPLALLASDRPEHVELVKQAMHAKPDVIKTHGRTWIAGWNIVFVGEYVNRTGDKSFLPLLAKLSNYTARGQTIGGAWGHGYSPHNRDSWSAPYSPGRPSYSSGNYGEVNAAGGPCFYGLVLAKKAGVQDQAVDDAIDRSLFFNSTWVDRGGCPYGYHSPVWRETNNGKNGPLAPAARLMGDTYAARYFALWCAVEASHGYTTGHGDGTFGRFWPALASSQAGRDVVIEWMKRVRPYYTMSRQHDGTFVSPANGMALGIGSLFDPTAMAVLHYSVPMAKLYMTGRDVPPECLATANDLRNLKDRLDRVEPAALSDDALLERLDAFQPRMRDRYAKELAARHAKGNADIVPKVKKLLTHSDRRAREGALRVLAECGRSAMEGMAPDLIERLKDPNEIVRTMAVHAIKVYAAGAEGSSKKLDLTEFTKPLLDAAVTDFPDSSTDLVNTVRAVSDLLLSTDNAFARDPLGQGMDPRMVRRAVQRFLSLDPRGGTGGHWDRKTMIQFAGPLLHVASHIEFNCKMFRGQAMRSARGMLLREKFVEGVEAGFEVWCTRAHFPRSMRRGGMVMTFTGPKGVGKALVPWLRILLPDQVHSKGLSTGGIVQAIRMISDYQTPDDWASIGELATRAFLQEVDAIGDRESQIALCRAELEPDSKYYFRQIGAMTRLAEYLGAQAVPLLAPFLIHEEWRVNDHARMVIRNMKAEGTDEALVGLIDGEDLLTAAALRLLGERGSKAGEAVGLEVLAHHKTPWVRGAAAVAVNGGSKWRQTAELVKRMSAVTHESEFDGYEDALLLGVGDKDGAPVVSESVRKVVAQCPPPVQRRMYYVLGQIGGSENLKFMRERVATKSRDEFSAIVSALSYSRGTQATELLLDILREQKGTSRLPLVSAVTPRRMVNGAEVVGDVPDEANLTFAERFLAIDRNTTVLAYLGNIPSRRSIALLLANMKLGPADVTSTSALAIGQAAEGLQNDKLSLEDRKVIAGAIVEVMEYISVVHMKGQRTQDDESVWHVLTLRLGAVLRDIYNPEERIQQAPSSDDEAEDIDI